MVTFTYEAAESVHALPAMRTHTAARHTLVDVHTGASVRSQPQPWRRTGASDRPLHHLAAVLTVGMETGASVPAAAVRLGCVSILTVTFIASRRVHAAMFARPRLHAALVQVMVTGLAGISWMTFTSVWSHTLSMFTALLTVRLTPPPLCGLPTPAAFHGVPIQTEAIRGRGWVQPTVGTPHTGQQNQDDPGHHCIFTLGHRQRRWGVQNHTSA